MVARHERTPGAGAIARAPDAEAAARASKPRTASASRSKRCPPKAFSMLAYVLKTSDLATLFRFVSADFFKVVPVGDLLSLGKELRRHADDHAAFSTACVALDARLVAGELALRVTDDKRSGGAPGEGGARAATAALDLFFFQIFTSETWLLDFRAAAFAASGLRSCRIEFSPFRIRVFCCSALSAHMRNRPNACVCRAQNRLRNLHARSLLPVRCDGDPQFAQTIRNQA